MFLHAVDVSPPNHSLRCFIGTARFGCDNARKVFNILFGNFVIILRRRCLLGWRFWTKYGEILCG